MPAGLHWIGYSGFEPRRRKRRKSCQSSRPPLSWYGRQMPEELHSTSEGRGFESRPAANKLLWQDSSGVEHRKRISPTPSCLLYHPFSGTADRYLGKLQLIRVSQVRILPRSKRVAQLVEHQPFPKKPSCPPYPPFYGNRRMPEGITLTCKVKNRIPSNTSRHAATHSRPSESAASIKLLRS